MFAVFLKCGLLYKAVVKGNREIEVDDEPLDVAIEGQGQGCPVAKKIFFLKERSGFSVFVQTHQNMVRYVGIMSDNGNILSPPKHITDTVSYKVSKSSRLFHAFQEFLEEQGGNLVEFVLEEDPSEEEYF